MKLYIVERTVKAILAISLACDGFLSGMPQETMYDSPTVSTCFEKVTEMEKSELYRLQPQAQPKGTFMQFIEHVAPLSAVNQFI